MENEKKLKFNPDDMIAAADEQFLEWMKNGRYAELIDTMPNLGRYSLRNQMLILMQNPKATCVNGMNAWNYKRRHIEKGQTSIRIIAPKFASQVSTDKDGNITDSTKGFSDVDPDRWDWGQICIFDCLTTKQGNWIVNDRIPREKTIRHLIPQESLRFMGFEDKDFYKCRYRYERKGSKKIRRDNVPDGEIYIQAGNSIAVNVLMALFGQIYGVPWQEKVFKERQKAEEGDDIFLRKMAEFMEQHNISTAEELFEALGKDNQNGGNGKDGYSM